MSLPELPEGMKWNLRTINSKLYVGIIPLEGYEWSYTFNRPGLPHFVSAFERPVKSKNKDLILETAQNLYSIVFGPTQVLKPKVRRVKPT